MSGQVTSQTKARPLLQGITEVPPGLFSSECAMPVGSRMARIFAEASDLLKRLFIAAGMSGVPSCSFCS